MQAIIEEHALRYVLRHVGDATKIQAHPLADGWRVEVYGSGQTEPAGILHYSLTGDLLPEKSTLPIVRTTDV